MIMRPLTREPDSLCAGQLSAMLEQIYSMEWIDYSHMRNGNVLGGNMLDCG